MRAIVAAAVMAAVLGFPEAAPAQATQRPNSPKARALSGPEATGKTGEKNSPLVEAARKTGAKKKSRISIDDEDVKKSTGKLTLLPEAKSEKPAEEKAPAPVVSKAVKEADAKLAAAKAEVDELEKELAKVEEDYYLESDPSYREQVIRPRFAETKKQLDRARENLLTARTERQSLDPVVPAKTDD